MQTQVAATERHHPPKQTPNLNAAKEENRIKAFREFLEAPTSIKAIRDVLPNDQKKDLERILRIAIMEFKSNEKLHDCTLKSVTSSFMSACRLGLEVGSLRGQAYLIPYAGKCTLVVGYKGLIELAYRTGSVRSIKPTTVHANDEFEILGGTESGIRHKICLGEKGAVIGYYIVVDLKDGRPLFHYMSKQEIEAHRDNRGKSSSTTETKTKDCGSFWRDFPEQMAYKTIFIKLFKWLPNNPFLHEVSEIEADEYSYSMSSESNHSQDRASEVANMIIDDEGEAIEQGELH